MAKTCCLGFYIKTGPQNLSLRMTVWALESCKYKVLNKRLLVCIVNKCIHVREVKSVCITVIPFDTGVQPSLPNPCIQ